MSLQRSKEKTGRAGSSTGLVALVGGLAFSEFGSAYMQSVYGPLLSQLGVRLHADAAQLNWISASYLLSSVILIPVLAKLGDLYGHKRMVMIALAIVTVGAVIAAFATSFPVFLAGMLVQGAVGALLPLEMAIIRDRAGEHATKGIGLLVGCLGAGGVAGILLSGYMGTFLDLTWVLLAPGVVVFISLVLIIFTVPETTVRGEGRVDWKGAALLAVGLALTLYAIMNGNSWGWLSPAILGMFIVGIGALIVFVRVEKGVSLPLIDISLVTRGGVGYFLILMLLFGAQQLGSGPIASLFAASKPAKVGYGFGLDSLGVSLTIVPWVLMSMVGSFIGYHLVRRFGQLTTLISSNVLVVLKFALLIVFSTNLPIFVAVQGLGGLGVGVFTAVLPAIVVQLAPMSASGIAGAMYNTTRTLAGAVGGAVFAGIMGAMFVSGTKIASLESFYVIWGICGALSLAVVILLPFSKRFGAARTMLPGDTVNEPDLGFATKS